MTPDALLRCWWMPWVGILGTLAGVGCCLLTTWLRDHHVSAIVTAATKSGWSKKEFAALLGISPARLSQWIGGTSPLDVERLWKLPESFQREWLAAQAALIGSRVLHAEDLALVRGFAAMDKPHMLRMTTPVVKAEEVA